MFVKGFRMSVDKISNLVGLVFVDLSDGYVSVGEDELSFHLYRGGFVYFPIESQKKASFLVAFETALVNKEPFFDITPYQDTCYVMRSCGYMEEV